LRFLSAIVAKDDDLDSLAGPGLFVDRVAVHDGQSRGLHDAPALAFGNALPRVAGASRVEVDAIRLNAFRLGGVQGPERLDAAREERLGARVSLLRRDAAKTKTLRLCAICAARAPKRPTSCIAP
jgi:hypothetical protein